METDEQRYERWLKQNKGFWFASCPEMDEWAKKKVKEGLLKPLSDFAPGLKHTDYWYIPAYATTVEDLRVYFSATGLNLFGIYEHNLNYQI